MIGADNTRFSGSFLLSFARFVVPFIFGNLHELYPAIHESFLRNGDNLVPTNLCRCNIARPLQTVTRAFRIQPFSHHAPWSERLAPSLSPLKTPINPMPSGARTCCPFPSPRPRESPCQIKGFSPILQHDSYQISLPKVIRIQQFCKK